MTDSLPLVTLGVPVRNGAAMLRAALDSMVAQDYPNIEIIVSDNASDDATPEILAEYAARYPNMRVVRQETALTAVENFFFVLNEAKGQFFAWCAHDDTRSPNYVSSLLRTFDAPDTVLSFGELRIWDGKSAPYPRSDYDFANDGLPTWRRLRKTALMQCYHIYGLWSVQALRKMKYEYTPWWPDMPIMLATSAQGYFRKQPAAHFTYYEFVKSDAERAAYQDYSSPRSKLRNLYSLLLASFVTVNRTHGVLLGTIATLFLIEKYSRQLVARFAQSRRHAE